MQHGETQITVLPIKIDSGNEKQTNKLSMTFFTNTEVPLIIVSLFFLLLSLSFCILPFVKQFPRGAASSAARLSGNVGSGQNCLCLVQGSPKHFPLLETSHSTSAYHKDLTHILHELAATFTSSSCECRNTGALFVHLGEETLQHSHLGG